MRQLARMGRISLLEITVRQHRLPLRAHPKK
jgi:hypothetical protein